MRGKWSFEIQKLKLIQQDLCSFKSDLAAIGGVSPRVVVEQLKSKWCAIQLAVQNRGKFSFFDIRLPLLMESLKNCGDEIDALLMAISEAEKIALTFTEQSQKFTEEAISSYEPTNVFAASSRLSSAFRDVAPFAKIKNAGGRLWSSLDRHEFKRLSSSSLKSDHDMTSPKGILANSLVYLLTSTDAELIDAMDWSLVLEGEIGHLLIQRLKDIVHSGESQVQIRSTAAKIIKRTLGNRTDGLFKCDFDALHIELTKVALHARLYPSNKKIWLATARMVMATVEGDQEQGMYLNCDDKKWTWHLNRIWLQAALILGFSIELVEQHFPRIETALLSQDGGASFLRELLRQVREDSQSTSQYHGGDAPTATAQEVLAILDMGCIISQDSDTNRIRLSSSGVRDDQAFLCRSSRYRSMNPLSHSFEGEGKASKSPMGTSPVQFFTPGSSEEMRQRNTRFLGSPVRKIQYDDIESPALKLDRSSSLPEFCSERDDMVAPIQPNQSRFSPEISYRKTKGFKSLTDDVTMRATITQPSSICSSLTLSSPSMLDSRAATPSNHF